MSGEFETEFTTWLKEQVPDPPQLDKFTYIEQVCLRQHQIEEIKKDRIKNNVTRNEVRKQVRHALENKDTHIQFCKGDWASHKEEKEDTDHGTWLKRAYSQYDSPILHTAESTFLFAARMLSYPLKFYKTWLKSMDESNEEITTTNPAYDDLAYKKKRQI
ncbi:hypothetical protein C6P44_002522 [Monosporozyma unispora]|nr:hypothetical protein C6P44_002522 [Kazachstania unispora]